MIVICDSCSDYSQHFFCSFIQGKTGWIRTASELLGCRLPSVELIFFRYIKADMLITDLSIFGP